MTSKWSTVLVVSTLILWNIGFSISQSSTDCLWSGAVNENSHTSGGIPQPQITTILDCQFSCLADTNCPKYGIDWDPSGTTNCYFSTSKTLSFSKGVTHYMVKSPDTCGGAQLRSDCNWKVSTNTGTDGGVITNYKYLVSCQTACYLTNGTQQANGNMGTGNCIGVDWNTATSTCYFTTKWASFTVNNVNHYTLICSACKHFISYIGITVMAFSVMLYQHLSM